MEEEADINENIAQINKDLKQFEMDVETVISKEDAESKEMKKFNKCYLAAKRQLEYFHMSPFNHTHNDQ